MLCAPPLTSANGMNLIRNNKFSSVTDKNEKMVFDECWGITSTLDGGAVMACGTGIEECELFRL